MPRFIACGQRFYKTCICAFALLLFCTWACGQTASTSFDSALNVALAVKNPTIRLQQLLTISKHTQNLTPRQGLKIEALLIDEAKTLGIDTVLMVAFENFGYYHFILDDYPLALTNYLKALEIAIRTSSFNREALIYDEIGWMYKTTGEISKGPGELEKAELYINKGIAVAHSHGLLETESSLLSDLATVYDIKKMHTKSIEIYKAQLARSVIRNGGVVALNLNLGISYKNNKQFGNALAAYKAALSLADSLSAELLKMFVLDNMAILYNEMGQYALSEKLAFDALGRSFNNANNAITVDIYGLLRKLYEKQGNYKLALLYADKLTAVKDSIGNTEKSAKLKDMQEKYETDLKDQQITLQRGQISNSQNLNLILGGGVLAVFFVALVIYVSLRKTAKLNRIVSSQRDALAKQSTALELAMKELHHRVKNNLQIVSSLLNLQSLRLTDQDAINAVQESRQRVQAMSLIHQRLYKTDDITRINMKEYIRELADFLATSYGYGPDDLTLDLEVGDEWVDIDKALPLGLILNELITNALKHAFMGHTHPRLQVIFERDGANNLLTVKDNGKGIDPAVWSVKQGGSFGRQLIKALCGQLRAKENLQVNNGTCFSFTIPLQAA